MEEAWWRESMTSTRPRRGHGWLLEGCGESVLLSVDPAMKRDDAVGEHVDRTVEVFREHRFDVSHGEEIRHGETVPRGEGRGERALRP